MLPRLTRYERPTEAPDATVRPFDAIALGAAFEREAPILLAAARAITLDDAEAQDLVQVTFELALRNVAALRDPRSLRPWLLTIQAREAFRVRRRLRRLVRIDVASPPVTVIATSTESVAIREALGKLSPRVRAAVVLHHMAGLSVAEVAAAMGTSENTVKSQLKIGLARLREDLGDD
jgi:RNA polymerase sigma-70 factor (ECF subfamily)